MFLAHLIVSGRFSGWVDGSPPHGDSWTSSFHLMTPPPPGLCPPLCPGGVAGSRGGRGHIFVLRALAQNGRTLHSHSMDRSSVAWQSVTCRTVPVACRGHKSAEISPAFPLPSHAVKGKDSFALTPAQILYGLAFALARAGGRRARRRGERRERGS